MCALKRRRHVVKRKKESDHVISVYDDLDQTMVRDGHNVLNDKVNLTLGERIVFPVIDEGLVVGLADAGCPLDHAFPKFFGAQPPLPDTFHNFSHRSGPGIYHSRTERKPIFCKSMRCDKC